MACRLHSLPGVRAAVYHLDAIMPRATAVDCSTQILVTGVGFSAVVAELPGGALACGAISPTSLMCFPSQNEQRMRSKMAQGRWWTLLHLST